MLSASFFHIFACVDFDLRLKVPLLTRVRRACTVARIKITRLKICLIENSKKIKSPFLTQGVAHSCSQHFKATNAPALSSAEADFPSSEVVRNLLDQNCTSISYSRLRRKKTLPDPFPRQAGGPGV